VADKKRREEGGRKSTSGDMNLIDHSRRSSGRGQARSLGSTRGGGERKQEKRKSIFVTRKQPAWGGKAVGDSSV